MNEQGSVNGGQTRHEESTESVQEDMLAVAALVAPNIPEVSAAVRTAAEGPELELIYALRDHRMAAQFDWKEDIQSVRDGLEYLTSYPTEAAWDWHPNFLAECEDWPSEEKLERFLELTGECLHEQGYVLVSIVTESDAYCLVVVPAADFVTLRDDRTDRWLRVLRLGTWSTQARPVNDRNMVGARTTMSDWDRFAEDLAGMIRHGLGGDTVVEFTGPAGFSMQISEADFRTLEVITPPHAFVDSEARDMTAEGWTLAEHDDGGYWWQTPLSNAHTVCVRISRRIATMLRRYGIESPTDLTATTWKFGNGTLPLWRMDIPVAHDH
ncbi:hypothetical protein [Nocardia sp. NPDC056100]|uniref:DUF6630 family protein n=1 Tax=Nocardia sp. NPDC056100 TaxID=3345712 RepID=UPI0035DB1C08